MLKRIGPRILGVAAFIYAMVAFDTLIGQHTSVLALIVLSGVAAVIQWRRVSRIQKEVGKVSTDDARTIRFNGTQQQAKIAAGIGRDMRWKAELIEDAEAGMASVVFSYKDNSSSAPDLLSALFNAGIAETVDS